MTLEQLILPQSSGKKSIAFQIIFSCMLLWVYNTNISKHFALSKLKERTMLLQTFLGRSGGIAFASTAIGVSAHFQGWWCRMKGKYKKLVFWVSSAINCGCTLTWTECLESHHFQCGFVLSSKCHCFPLTLIFVCMLMNVILDFVACSSSEQR